VHELAKERLARLSEDVTFVERSFKKDDWMKGLGKFDCLITNQAVHELRHKSLAPNLHAQARSVLTYDAFHLVNDHFVGKTGVKNSELYMSREEQIDMLCAAGFSQVRERLRLAERAFRRAI
jgi:hypothetical protein